MNSVTHCIINCSYQNISITYLSQLRRGRHKHFLLVLSGDLAVQREDDEARLISKDAALGEMLQEHEDEVPAGEEDENGSSLRQLVDVEQDGFYQLEA